MLNSAKTYKPDLKCIWMLSGLINYKLCNQNFACDQCEFNRVMHGISPNTLPPEEFNGREGRGYVESPKEQEVKPGSYLIHQFLYKLFSGCTIHLDRIYHPSHLWSKLEKDNIHYIGIEPITIKILKPIDEITLPEESKYFHIGQPITWIIRRKKSIPLCSHTEGSVIKINPTMKNNNWRLIIHKDTYLFKMQEVKTKTQSQQEFGYMHGFKWHMHNVEILCKYINLAFEENHFQDTGMTLADGGESEYDLENVIGSEIFNKLVSELYTQS